MKKRVLLFGLMILTVLSIFVGCSSKDKSSSEENDGNSEPSENFNVDGYPVVDETITMTMFGRRQPAESKWQDMNFFQFMEEKTNIEFEFNTPQAQGEDYEQKRDLVFASGPLPDVFFAADLPDRQIVENGGNGILIPLEYLIDEYAPNIKKALEANPDVEKSITSPDGHIYVVPRISTRLRMSFNGWHFNREWLEELDVEELPETTDELYDLLSLFKDEYPDKTPLSANEIGQFGNSPIASAFGFMPNGEHMMLKDDKAVYAPAQEEYKDYLEYMQKLYDEKLLDNNVFTPDLPKYRSEGAEGNIGLGVDGAPMTLYQFDDFNDTGKSPVLPPMTSPNNDEKVVPKTTGMGKNAFAITKENDHPEAAIRWVDYLYTEEGAQLAQVGEEGVGWEWNDDETEWDMLAKAPEGNNRAEFRASVVPVGPNVPYYMKQEWVEAEGIDNPYLQEMFEETYEPYAKDIFPDIYLTADEEKEANRIYSDMDNYRDEMQANFITGKKSLDEFDDYVEQLKGIGMDEYVEIYQDAYDRWKEAE